MIYGGEHDEIIQVSLSELFKFPWIHDGQSM